MLGPWLGSAKKPLKSGGVRDDVEVWEWSQ